MDMELHKTELEEFGFTVVKDLIPKETAELMSKRVMTIKNSEEGYASGDTVFNSLNPAEYELFLPLIKDLAVQELANHMLGPNFRLCGDIGILWSKPGDPAQGLHTDMPVYNWYSEKNRPVEYCPCMQTIWALTDFTKENGATEIIPFSHKSLRNPREIDYVNYLAPMEAPAGSVILFHGSLWHRRGHNITSNQHRVGISVPHIAAWLDPVSVGWKQINRRVRDQLPKEVQHLFPHVDENSAVNKGGGPKY